MNQSCNVRHSIKETHQFSSHRTLHLEASIKSTKDLRSERLRLVGLVTDESPRFFVENNLKILYFFQPTDPNGESYLANPASITPDGSQNSDP